MMGSVLSLRWRCPLPALDSRTAGRLRYSESDFHNTRIPRRRIAPMQDWLSLDRRPTLVFGAGGLGGASALSLAAQGARVALADVNEENLDVVVRAAKEAGDESKPLVADLRTAEACRAAVREAVAMVGTPQIFLHAVGRNVRKPILDLDDADWQETLSLNLSSAYWLGQAVGRLMVQERY